MNLLNFQHDTANINNIIRFNNSNDVLLLSAMYHLPSIAAYFLTYCFYCSIYNRRADNITIYTKMAVEVVEFCCLLLYKKEEQMS